MTIDLTNPDDRASMISAIADLIISSNDDKSIRQHAELILDEYIIRTNHHIWLVNQCAKILKDVVAKRGLDVDLFMTNCEFHDYDKLHNSEIIPTYAIACHYFYFHNKKVDYKIDEKKVHDEFENVAWPKHHRANKHHVAEYYGTKNEKGTLIVPETNDFLSIIEMYADWMAMGITNGGTARDWWTKTYGEDRKWRFTGADIALIQQCIMTEHAAENQLAYLRQFKDVEPTWVPPTEIETHESENPIEINKVNEGIENFFNYVSNEDLSLKRDDLYIGPIDPMIVDPVKMMKLAEYPAYLLALKKWTTTPDHDLAPELMAFGKIVDEIYQFKNPITCYRGIRTGFSTRPKQNLMGVIDDEITYLRLLKPGFNKPGATFEFETPEPMSVARSPYLAKVYGNFIVKTEVPPDAPKLVITPELSYLLQQMEVEYPEYRAVNLSVTHEVIVFAGVKLQFEIVSVYGDISSELETMRDHSLEGLGNTPMNGVYYSIDGISDEALLSFLNTGLYKTITNIAKPMYKPLGQNSWQHIQQVYSQASRICKKVLNRALTPVEYAAILFHDCSVIDSGKDDHEKHSADKAVKALADVFNEVELDTIHRAIVEHDQPQGPATFSSIVSQLVAAGDFNPPDVDWMLNKSYVWGISHGMEHEKRLENTYNLMRSAYGSKGFMYERMPEVYKKYFASKIKEVQKTFDKMTIEEAEKRIMEYRKKHHLSETDTSLPESSVEAISQKQDKKLTLKKITGTDEEVKLSLPLLNAARTASGHEAENEDGVRKWLKRSDTEWFFVYDGSTLVGMTNVEKCPASSVKYFSTLNTDCIEIGEVAIAKEHRGKGYGVSLVKTIVAYIQKNYPKKPIIIRCVSKNNAAVGCYKKAGFVLNLDDQSMNDPNSKHGSGYTLIWNGDNSIKRDKHTTRKHITFPKEEIEKLKKQDRIITTRVSKDYEKFQKGDEVFTPWYALFKISDRKEISKIEDHPYYKELTKEQIAFLSKYDKIAILTLTKISDPETPSNEVLAEQAIRDGFLYHGSCNRYSVLKPQPQSDIDHKKSISLTPYKRVASMFTVPISEIGQGQYKKRVIYLSDWFDTKITEEDKYQIVKEVHVYHNMKDVPKIDKIYTGYLYTIKAEEALKDASENPKWNVPDEVLSYVPELHPVKVETVRTRLIAEYNPQKAGADHDAIPVNETGLEALSPEQLAPIKDELYHGSPEDKEILSGYSRAKQYKNSVFLSPLKGIASLFVISTEDKYGPNHGYRNIHWKYDAWSMPTTSLTSPRKHVIIYHNAKNFEDHSGESEGYLYTVKVTEDIKRQLKLFGSGDTQREVRYESTTPLQYSKKEKITISWETKYDPNMEKEYGAAVEQLTSTEALAPDIKKKKQLIIDYICSVCDIMDPSKLNSKRYHRLLDSMNDKEFDQWMNYVKEGKWKIHIVAPNLVVTLKNENSLKAADKVKCKLFHRLWMTDDSTGRQYLTDNEYLVLNLPVRRQQQFLDEKMSVPDNDRQIDGMTGQVTGDSKSSAVTNPEIQILAARGLDATLEELVNVRGGNIAAYSDFKRQAEETGEIKLNSLDPNTRSRVAVVGQVLLRSMMIENNIVE